MHLGTTSFRLTSLLAAGRRRRKLRGDLKVSPQVIGGQTSYVVKLPDTGEYLRYTELLWEVLSTFDGTRTDREVWEELNRAHPGLSLSLAGLEDLVDGAESSLWERTLSEKNLALLEKIRGERQERARDGQSVFHLSFAAWDPDRFFDLAIPYLRWIWTRGFVIASLVLLLVGAVVFVADHERIFRDTARFYSFGEQSLGELLDFWILLFVVSFVHECAHGLTGKSFGGEIHQMGFMLIYFTPAFYTDVSDIYLFDKDYKRHVTILAGVWIETVLCALSLVVWTLAPPGSSVGYWSYKLMLMTSITGVLFNLNPLMKFDGYYLLCQLLKIDNLREDSFKYLKQWTLHLVSGGQTTVERAGRRKHRIFLLFGSLALAYSVLITAVVVLFVKNVAVAKLGTWGWAVTAGFAWLILRKRLASLRRGLGGAFRVSREAFMRWRDRRGPWAAAAAAALFLLVAPTQARVMTGFVLEPGAGMEVRAPVAGVIREVAVREGDRVRAGAVLARLDRPDLTARGLVLEARLLLAERQLLAAHSAGDSTTVLEASGERARLLAERHDVRSRLTALALSSPMDATVMTPDVHQRLGEYLHEGEALCALADRTLVRARVLVRDAELEDVVPGAAVALKANAYPFETFEGRVERVMPAAATDRPPALDKLERDGQELYNYFAVTLVFANRDDRLREGMTGTAKIYGRRASPVMRAFRSSWRWGRSQIWF